jgi:hypothetical protein
MNKKSRGDQHDLPERTQANAPIFLFDQIALKLQPGNRLPPA